MENKNYSTVFEADLAYLRSLGDTSECKTEFEVRLKTLRKLGGDIQTTTPLLYEIEKKILEFLGGDSSLYDNIYFIRKAIAEKQGVNTEGLHTIYAIAVASLNSEPIDVKYTITFKNYDGTILDTQSLSLNDMPVYTGETPVKPSDSEYNYTFNGWLPEISPVSGNAEYVAQYTATEIEYTVTFKNYDGTILSTQKVLSGELPVYEGSTPVRESDGEYNYTFNGWLPEISPVSGNAEYVAQFEATAIPVGPDLTLPYVTFTAEEANSTIGLAKLSTNQTLEYSTDTTNWNTMDNTTTITLANTGDKAYIRGILSDDNTYSNCTQFKMTGKIAVSGNCNAIWNYQDLEAPLKKLCGINMFRDCTSLTTAPELPATTLSTRCYGNMFYGCTSLTEAPELPATELAEICYSYMFYGCTSLTTAPELPATTLASKCYSDMFEGCTSLTTAPELPATTLTTECYSYMFEGCTSLITAPSILPATTLAGNCYNHMFSGCSKLNKITCLATNIIGSNSTASWLYDVSATGTFIKDPNMNDWTAGRSGIPDGWTVENYGESDGPDLTIPYVTFKAEEANSTIGLSQLSSNQTLEYSTDTTNWNTMNTTTNITLANTGDKAYIRGILSADNSGSNNTRFKMTGKIAASGNCNAIWNYQDLEAPLKNYCGYYMFYQCYSLVTAPELPATELAESCYYGMFMNCTSLTTAPELPATTLTSGCYGAMFFMCTSLTTAPELPATTLASYCYSSMFKQCSSLVKAPTLPATTLAQSCYDSMFYGCKLLVEAPELPATTLASRCYAQLFDGCTKLNKITCLATDISASSCTLSWSSDLSPTGTFIKHPDMNNWTTGSSGIPSGWTVEDYVG